MGSGVTPRGGEAVYKTEGHPFVRCRMENVGLGNLLLDDIAFIDEEKLQSTPKEHRTTIQ